MFSGLLLLLSNQLQHIILIEFTTSSNAILILELTSMSANGTELTSEATPELLRVAYRHEAAVRRPQGIDLSNF